MKLWFIPIFIVFFACGQRHLSVKSVAAQYDPVFDSLAASVNAIAGHELLVRGATGISIVIDSQRLADETQNQGVNNGSMDMGTNSIVGLWIPSEAEILLEPFETWIPLGPGQQYMLSRKTMEVVLAHELGHALGLHHVSTGLMQPTLTGECFGHAAQCLVDALNLK